jgi:hypothetical protein
MYQTMGFIHVAMTTKYLEGGVRQSALLPSTDILSMLQVLAT